MMTDFPSILAQATYYYGGNDFYHSPATMGGMYSGLTLVGLALVLITALIGGATCILVPQFSVDEYAEILKKQKPNIIPNNILFISISIRFTAFVIPDNTNRDLATMKVVLPDQPSSLSHPHIPSLPIQHTHYFPLL